MGRASEPIEITSLGELRRVVAEVQATNEPRCIRVDGGALALLSPAPASGGHERRQVSEADEAAFRSAAGSWKGIVDGEALKRQIAESRGQTARWSSCDSCHT